MLKIKSFLGVSTLIAEGVKATATKDATQKVVDARVLVEVNIRADLLEKCLTKYDAAKKELSSLRADVVTHSVVKDDVNKDSGASTKNESWSAGQWARKEKLQKLIADFDIAFMHAFDEEKPDWEKMKKLSSGDDNQKSGNAK